MEYQSLEMEQTGSWSNVHYTGSVIATDFDMMVTQEDSVMAYIEIDNNHVNFNQSLKRNPEDHYIPIANVIKIMRQVLPPNVKILDDSKEIIQECASEFISFITREANEKCYQECRRIIKPEDILSAMGSTGFDNYIEPLAVFLQKHRNDSRVTPNPAQTRPAPKGPEAVNLIQQPQSQPAIFRPDPRVVQPTMSFGHASPSTSTFDQTNADEFSQILDYFMSNQGAQGEDYCGGSLFEPYINEPLN